MYKLRNTNGCVRVFVAATYKTNASHLSLVTLFNWNNSGLHNFPDFWLICLICDHINPHPFIHFNLVAVTQG